MKIAVASNHMGFKVKADVIEQLRELGHESIDLGPSTDDICDYPDYAALAARAVSNGQVDRAILVGGTGIGMSIVANKFRRVRAALCYDELTVRLSRCQYDANVLCISANIFCEEMAGRLIKIWLDTPFDHGHHSRRIGKIAILEQSVNPRNASSSHVESVKSSGQKFLPAGSIEVARS